MGVCVLSPFTIAAIIAQSIFYCSDIGRTPDMGLLVFGTPSLDDVADVSAFVLHLGVVAHCVGGQCKGRWWVRGRERRARRRWLQQWCGRGDRTAGLGARKRSQKIGRKASNAVGTLVLKFSELLACSRSATVRYVIAVSARHSNRIDVSAIRNPLALCRGTTAHVDKNPVVSDMHHGSRHGCSAGPGSQGGRAFLARHRRGWRRRCLKCVRFPQARRVKACSPMRTAEWITAMSP